MDRRIAYDPFYDPRNPGEFDPKNLNFLVLKLDPTTGAVLEWICDDPTGEGGNFAPTIFVQEPDIVYLSGLGGIYSPSPFEIAAAICVTAKYDLSRSSPEVWSRIFRPAFPFIPSLAVDSTGVYVTTATEYHDLTTQLRILHGVILKYDLLNGDLLWKYEDTSSDLNFFTSIQVSQEGVFVTGGSATVEGDWFVTTAKHSPDDGNRVWIRHGWDLYRWYWDWWGYYRPKIKLDQDGNILVISPGYYNEIFQGGIIKYSADGIAIGTAGFNGLPSDLAITPPGVYVTGTLTFQGPADYITALYDHDLNLIWEARYGPESYVTYYDAAVGLGLSLIHI